MFCGFCKMRVLEEGEQSFKDEELPCRRKLRGQPIGQEERG